MPRALDNAYKPWGWHPSKEELCYLYWDKNMTLMAIGELYGVSNTTVRNWCHKLNISIKTQSQALKGRSRPWSAANGSKACLRLNKINNPSKRSEVRAKRSQQQSEIMKRIWATRPEVYNNMIAAMRAKWNDSEEKKLRLKRMAKGVRFAGTKGELMVYPILFNYSTTFLHNAVTGHSYNGKVPDFVNNELKVIVEVFGRWYHDLKLNPAIKLHRTPPMTIQHYVDLGYRILIIWSDELKLKGWESRLHERLDYLLNGNTIGLIGLK